MHDQIIKMELFQIKKLLKKKIKETLLEKIIFGWGWSFYIESLKQAEYTLSE